MHSQQSLPNCQRVCIGKYSYLLKKMFEARVTTTTLIHNQQCTQYVWYQLYVMVIAMVIVILRWYTKRKRNEKLLVKQQYDQHRFGETSVKCGKIKNKWQKYHFLCCVFKILVIAVSMVTRGKSIKIQQGMLSSSGQKF